MPTVQDVLDELERIAPASAAFPWDKIGLQVGRRGQQVASAVVALDRSLAAVEFAAARGAQLLLTHHPLLFDPLTAVTDDSITGQTVRKLIQSDISFIAAHTNWDAARGGINDALAARLGLEGCEPFGSSSFVEDLKVVVFVPSSAVDAMLDACSEAGAGVIGLYSRCAFLTDGMGTYHGEEGSNPTIGEAEQVEATPEVRIEMICPASKQRAVTRAIQRTHPYEEPAFDFIQLAKRPTLACGRIGQIAPMSLEAFASHVEQALGTKCWTWGPPSETVKKVAVVGGAADGDFRAAKSAGADVFVTGEVKQHIALEAGEIGIPIVAAGHYATEQPGCAALRDAMSAKLGEIEWVLFEPERGLHGRPF